MLLVLLRSWNPLNSDLRMYFINSQFFKNDQVAVENVLFL